MGRFVAEHFCGCLFYRKMEALGEWRDTRVVFFVGGALDELVKA